MARAYSAIRLILAASDGRYPYTEYSTGQMSSVQLALGPKTTTSGGSWTPLFGDTSGVDIFFFSRGL